MHIQRHTHTQAHMYNQHTRKMATTRHRSLVERGGRKALLETLHTHKKKKQKKNVRKKLIFTNQKKRFEHIKLPAKLLDYFLRSNKSNINQISCIAAGGLTLGVNHMNLVWLMHSRSYPYFDSPEIDHIFGNIYPYLYTRVDITSFDIHICTHRHAMMEFLKGRKEEE